MYFTENLKVRNECGTYFQLSVSLKTLCIELALISKILALFYTNKFASSFHNQEKDVIMQYSETWSVLPSPKIREQLPKILLDSQINSLIVGFARSLYWSSYPHATKPWIYISNLITWSIDVSGRSYVDLYHLRILRRFKSCRSKNCTLCNGYLYNATLSNVSQACENCKLIDRILSHQKWRRRDGE